MPTSSKEKEKRRIVVYDSVSRYGPRISCRRKGWRNWWTPASELDLIIPPEIGPKSKWTKSPNFEIKTFNQGTTRDTGDESKFSALKEREKIWKRKVPTTITSPSKRQIFFFFVFFSFFEKQTQVPLFSPTINVTNERTLVDISRGARQGASASLGARESTR